MLGNAERALESIVNNETISFQDGLRLLGSLLEQNDAVLDNKPSRAAANANHIPKPTSTLNQHQADSFEGDAENGGESSFVEPKGSKGTTPSIQRYADLLLRKSEAPFAPIKFYSQQIGQ